VASDNDTIKVWQPLALSVMLALGMLFGYKMNDQGEQSLLSFVDEDSGQVGQVEELIRFIEERYVDTVSRGKLIDKAMDAVLNELDPHSVYISPEQIGKVNEEMEGKFRGIGVEIFYIDDTVNVISTVPGGPAEKAGVKSFDKLIQINDSIVAGQGLAFADIRKMLRGDIGEKLQLQILTKENRAKTADIRIDDIPVSSVNGGLMIDDKTGYIKIERFGSNTYREFMDFVQVLSEEKRMENLVIDLRDNPGGYLPQATNILSQLFKEKGQLMVYTQGKKDKKLEYKSNGKAFFKVGKISVLIDENSASGSEIMAGAIQDWDRGVIVGRRSFGKGLVQEQYELNNGGALRLTVARYYTPSGRSIQREYDSSGSYYSDYEDRYYAGELFSADSITNENKPLYKTMSLDRPVFGGGGITPDIFIPVDSIIFDPFYREVMGELPRFTFQYLSRNNEVTSDNMLDVAMSIYDSYMSEKAEFDKDGTLKSMKNDILDQINGAVIKYSQGAQDLLKYQLPSDEFVKESLQYFYSDGQLTDLMTRDEGK